MTHQLASFAHWVLYGPDALAIMIITVIAAVAFTMSCCRFTASLHTQHWMTMPRKARASDALRFVRR